MKKTNILKLIVTAAIACITIVATVALAGCGSSKSAELVGTYKAYRANNHSDAADGYQYEYTLELYSDNTYRMEHNAFYCIPYWTGVSERTVIQYGTYTTGGTEEEGKAVYELGKPNRVIFMAMCGGYNGLLTEVKAYADTDNWSKCSPADEETGSLVYALQSRSETEEYASADQLINTLGRAYKVTCDVDGLHRMTVEVTSHGGKQINGYDNIIVEEDGWPA